MDDKTILQHVTELVEEERNLRSDASDPGQDAKRLQHLEEQLDQCWDLLRLKTVEGYQR